MSILDTNLIIEKIKKKEEIHENVTEISVLEFPPILKIYLVERRDFDLALKLQVKLRNAGMQKAVPDLLIASIFYLSTLNSKSILAL